MRLVLATALVFAAQAATYTMPPLCPNNVNCYQSANNGGNWNSCTCGSGCVKGGFASRTQETGYTQFPPGSIAHQDCYNGNDRCHCGYSRSFYVPDPTKSPTKQPTKRPTKQPTAAPAPTMQEVGNGVCSGGYMGSNSGTVSSADACIQRCNGLTSCRFAAYCGSNCDSRVRNKCALYTSGCGAVQTSGGVDWNKYKLYTNMVMNNAGKGVCSGGYMSGPSGTMASASACKARCQAQYSNGCRYAAFCGSNCDSRVRNKCALYTSSCGQVQTSGGVDWGKYNLYAVADSREIAAISRNVYQRRMDAFAALIELLSADLDALL